MVIVGGILKLKNNVFKNLQKTLLVGRNVHKSRYAAAADDIGAATAG